MATKKTAKKHAVKIDTTPNEKEIRKAWLQSFTSTKNSASRLCTLPLQKGATISELKKIASDYASKQQKPQKWGSKNSDITGHFRWLQNKGYTVTSDDSGKYTLTV